MNITLTLPYTPCFQPHPTPTLLTSPKVPNFHLLRGRPSPTTFTRAVILPFNFWIKTLGVFQTPRELSQFYCWIAALLRKAIRMWALLCTVNSISFWDGWSSPQFSFISCLYPAHWQVSPSSGWLEDQIQISQSSSSLCGKEGRSWEVMWILVLQVTPGLQFLGYCRQVIFTHIKAQFNHRLIGSSLLFWIVSQDSHHYPEISDQFLRALEDFPVTGPQGVQRYQVSEYNLMGT